MKVARVTVSATTQGLMRGREGAFAGAWSGVLVGVWTEMSSVAVAIVAKLLFAGDG
jgi:hypothetical protein